ncbi:hypothetical protein QR680_005821 [Steinernema hermaphroditum]|uniref:E2F/DP family winged-helix DNA-binding domain-containing protein n=1 Tax=Steinernema hermaphroditum TaxID=289476 RepID=A0AA39HUS2_9BILA|nr:hypothetical protein QR680_005821 [Steinernema hermaphroditum]
MRNRNRNDRRPLLLLLLVPSPSSSGYLDAPPVIVARIASESRLSRQPSRKKSAGNIRAMAENVAPQKTSQDSEEVDVCTVDATQLKPLVPAPNKPNTSKASPSNYSRKRSLEHSEDDDCDADPVSRKEKSLGKLCQKFLTVMQEEESRGHDIHLETVAKSMNVEKRRIYDIVNVMEALDAMAKTNKSYYKWHGLRRLPQLMAVLQRQAAEEGLPERVAHVEQAMCNFTEIKRRSSGASGDVVGSLIGIEDKEASIPESPQSSQSSTMSLDTLSQSAKIRVNRDRYGQNSLANLCRRFLMVLLCNPDSGRKVSLDVASTVLIKDPETEGFEPPSRSRCRRLYDIANVLVAMNLIKKVHYLFGTKKIPLFVYCGPNPDEHGVNWNADLCSASKSVSPPPAKRASLSKLAELAEYAERERKLLEAAAKSLSAPTPSAPMTPPENDENAAPLGDIVKPTPKPGAFLLTDRTNANPFRVLSNRLASEETLRSLMANQAALPPLKPISTVWKQVGLLNSSSLANRAQSSNALPLSPIYQIHNPTSNAPGMRFAPRKSFPVFPIVRPKTSTVSHSVSNILGVRNQNTANIN